MPAGAAQPGAAARWVGEHLGAAPPALLRAMRQALADSAAGGSLPDQLAGAALRLYGQLAGGDAGGGRADALPLLAADALLTHALQAQGELDPAGLEGFVRRWGAPGELAGLLPAPR